MAVFRAIIPKSPQLKCGVRQRRGIKHVFIWAAAPVRRQAGVVLMSPLMVVMIMTGKNTKAATEPLRGLAGRDGNHFSSLP